MRKRKANSSNGDSDFPKKILDKIPEDILADLEKMSADDLREKIVKTEALIVDNDKESEEDPKIKVLKEDLNLLISAYKEVRTGAQAIIKYSIFLLRKQGHSLK